MNTTEHPADVRLLKLAAVCERLDVSPRTLDRIIADGHLAVVRIGEGRNAARRVRSDELHRYIESLDTVRHASARQIRTAVEGRSTP